MSTTIEINCHGTVKVQPIAHTICRIGSSPGLELCMPGIETHAATLRIQNGKRQIYNRSPRTIQLNGKPVAPEQTTQWQENQLLELADGVSLRLLSAKDEAKPNPKPSVETPLATKNAPNPGTAVSDKTGRQLTIAGFFFVFATILFTSDSSSNDKLASQEFSALIETLLKEEDKNSENSGRYRQIRIDLQNAFLRTDLQEASIRSVKQNLSKTSLDQRSDIDLQVTAFVQDFFKNL